MPSYVKPMTEKEIKRLLAVEMHARSRQFIMNCLYLKEYKKLNDYFFKKFVNGGLSTLTHRDNPFIIMWHTIPLRIREASFK